MPNPASSPSSTAVSPDKDDEIPQLKTVSSADGMFYILPANVITALYRSEDPKSIAHDTPGKDLKVSVVSSMTDLDLADGSDTSEVSMVGSLVLLARAG